MNEKTNPRKTFRDIVDTLSVGTSNRNAEFLTSESGLTISLAKALRTDFLNGLPLTAMMEVARDEAIEKRSYLQVGRLWRRAMSFSRMMTVDGDAIVEMQSIGRGIWTSTDGSAEFSSDEVFPQHSLYVEVESNPFDGTMTIFAEFVGSKSTETFYKRFVVNLMPELA